MVIMISTLTHLEKSENPFQGRTATSAKEGVGYLEDCPVLLQASEDPASEDLRSVCKQPVKAIIKRLTRKVPRRAAADAKIY